MTKRMIIDASHREETRVVVLDGQKVEEFDFEAATKRPLKGNIYLAKVTRVEPSLQAAFVEYGGNRQGFLAFAEIHPDYYQIPIADRLALLAEQEAEARRHEDEDVESIDIASVPGPESAADTAALSLQSEENDSRAFDEFPDELSNAAVEQPDAPPPAEQADPEAGPELLDAAAPSDLFENTAAAADPEQAETQSAAAGAPAQSTLRSTRPPQRWARKRHYKIQEVIKRRQVILVQVVKEERGNKGAALTTYLSLAGRYCVLMPNTPRGGGISRKITSAADRTRLKSAAQSLELPEGMGLIIRTAGENRTKAEIKRDYEYLLRMWDTIRELTLKSNAPACVYEEGDLIKRAIRDLYNKDVTEILVEGEDGYRNAKEFMRMLMPSHAKNVKPYKEAIPLFQRYQIEAQLDAMFMPTVTLKSGGYIVINQTEALVSIDVNSGKATREHSIEDTAYKTNMEAAEEIARQLRLRDLAGLIVIDFIDMEDDRNDRNVEKKLRDCIKCDRARVQIGKISQFGLLEMSRQRLRAGVVAGSTIPCPHCGGQGIVRSVESTALRLLRALEEEAQRQRAAGLGVRAPTEVAVYALNQKRREIAHIESEYALAIQFEAVGGMMAGTFEIERVGQRAPEDRARPAPPPERSLPAQAVPVPEPVDAAEDAEEEEPSAQPAGEPAAGTSNGGSKRRRRRRRGGRERTAPSPLPESAKQPEEVGTPPAVEQTAGEPAVDRVAENGAPPAEEHAAVDSATGRKRRRRRRGRRGSHDNGVPAPQGIQTGLQATAPAAADGSGGMALLEPDRGAAVALPDLTAFANTPNAPSEPVWSLSLNQEQSGRHEAPRKQTPEPVHEPMHEPVAEAAHEPLHEREPAAEELQAPSPALAPPPPPPPAEPPRKGWWQRPFRARE